MKEYDIEQQLMEAYVLEKTDAEIGMPDIEAELQRMHVMADRGVSRGSGVSRGARGVNGASRGTRDRVVRRVASVAASILLVAGVGIAGYTYLSADRDICVAYVGGERITDEEQVMALLAKDMAHLSSGDEIIEDQLNDVFN